MECQQQQKKKQFYFSRGYFFYFIFLFFFFFWGGGGGAGGCSFVNQLTKSIVFNNIRFELYKKFVFFRIWVHNPKDIRGSRDHHALCLNRNTSNFSVSCKHRPIHGNMF